MFTNTTGADFKRGILIGVCRSLRAGNHNTAVVYSSEIIKDEIHIRLQPQHSFKGGDSETPSE